MRLSGLNKLYLFAAAVLGSFVALSLWWHHRLHPALSDVLSARVKLALATTLFHVDGAPVRVLFVVKTIAFFVVLALLSRLCRWAVEHLLTDDERFGAHRRYVISKFLTVAIYVFGFLIGVRVERISVHTFFIVGGTLGVAIGLGTQRVVGNVIAGLFLLMEQPVRLGDYVEVDTKAGFVIRVGTSSSWIRTINNAVLILPNADLVSKNVLNWSILDRRIRLVLPVPVAYGNKPETVLRVLRELVRDHADLLDQPEPAVLLTSLGPAGITFEVRVWIDQPASEWDRIRSELNTRILDGLAERNIRTPHTELDLYFKPKEPV